MERFELCLKNQFFINKFNKYKFMAYQDLRFNQKHKKVMNFIINMRKSS